MLFIKEKPRDYQGTETWTGSSRQEAKEAAAPLKTAGSKSNVSPMRTRSEGPEPHTVSTEPAHGSGFPKQVPAQTQIWDRTWFSDLKVIGQYQDIYIVCEFNQDLILLDQHAAHERILYAKLKQSRKTTPASQGLLIPETIELNYREAKVLENFLPELETLGFGIEPFGGDTFAVTSVPAVLGEHEIKTLVVAMVEKWIEDGSADVVEKAIDDSIKLMACHGAIQANQRLTDMEIKAMLKQLDACDDPSNCPHGRPTWIKLSKQFFEKAFKRMV